MVSYGPTFFSYRAHTIPRGPINTVFSFTDHCTEGRTLKNRMGPYWSIRCRIGVARIFNWEGLKFNKSYPTAGTDPENFIAVGDADLN